MDASKLRNSCICGNTRPYLECCGIFADPAPSSGPPAVSRLEVSREGRLYYDFRHVLHELSMALFPLRALYQGYWEKLAKEDYPHDLLMEDPDYGRAVVDNFFWDYSLQYSDARPILRTARDLEGKDLRLAHDLMQWSYAPLWFYQIEETGPAHAQLRNLGTGRMHRVFHAGRMPQAGSGLLSRILPFRGKEFCGHTVLAFEPGTTPAPIESLFRAGCRELGVKSSVNLRPDVHCEEWRRHGSIFLGVWRGAVYDARIGRPYRGSGPAPVFTAPAGDKDALAKALAASPGVTAAGNGAWEMRFRGLKLARLESKGGNVQVTLADPAFRDFIRGWLREKLGGEAPLAGPRESAARIPSGAGQLPGDSSAALDAWVHTPLETLNGQTPIQASTHDWGRRRLHILFKEMSRLGRDVASLRQQLGL